MPVTAPKMLQATEVGLPVKFPTVMVDVAFVAGVLFEEMAFCPGVEDAFQYVEVTDVYAVGFA